MELENLTPFPSAIFRGCIDNERLFASVVSRITFNISDEALTFADEQIWPVSAGPFESPYGLMTGDELFYRGGVDVFVFGSARAPHGIPARQSEVRVEIGDRFCCSISVFGDRVWQRTNGRLAVGQPEEFLEMPLTLSQAFGGVDEWDELPIPYQYNPIGVGYYLNEESADGQRLPNIECPENLVENWNDRPNPVGVGVCPMGFGPRLNESVEFDKNTGQMIKLHPTFFNAAFPRMVAASASAGDLVVVSGVRAEGPIQFKLPSLRIQIRLGFGNQVTELAPQIDQIGIETDLGRVFVTFRYPFRYTLIPLQKRFCQLVFEGNGDSK